MLHMYGVAGIGCGRGIHSLTHKLWKSLINWSPLTYVSHLGNTRQTNHTRVAIGAGAHYMQLALIFPHNRSHIYSPLIPSVVS